MAESDQQRREEKRRGEPYFHSAFKLDFISFHRKTWLSTHFGSSGRISQGRKRSWTTGNWKPNAQQHIEIDGLPTFTKASAALPIGGSPPNQSPNTTFRRRSEGISELEAFWSSPPPYRQQVPLSPPPAPDSAAPDADISVQIRQLQMDVTNKENQIRRLEAEVEAERDIKRSLQAERHEAVDAQRRAKGELWRLRIQVANLDELLDASIKREKDLESELDTARAEITKLKRQLHEEQSSYESDVRAQEVRERQMRQQLEDSHCTLEEEVRRNRVLAAGFAERQIQVEATRRSRRSDRSMSGRAFISIPTGSNRRVARLLS